MARVWKFLIYEEEELYCPCSENKGADQLCSYCEANLHLYFCIHNMLVLSYDNSIGERIEHVFFFTSLVFLKFNLKRNLENKLLLSYLVYQFWKFNTISNS